MELKTKFNAAFMCYKYLNIKLLRILLFFVIVFFGLVYYKIAPRLPNVHKRFYDVLQPFGVNDDKFIDINAHEYREKYKQYYKKTDEPILKFLNRNKTEAYIKRTYYNDKTDEQVSKDLHRNNMKEYIKKTNIYGNEEDELIETDLHETKTGTVKTVETQNLDVHEYNKIKIKEAREILKLMNNTKNKMFNNAARKTDENKYFFQGQWIQKPTFISGKLDHFYLFSAFIHNVSNSPLSTMRILGQWHLKYSKYINSVKCCFKYSDNTVIETRVRHHMKSYPARIRLFNIVCSVPNGANVKSKRPSKVGISFYPYSCASARIPYIRPVYPRIEKNTLGICTKIAYSSLSSSNLIEWLEAMKYLGVDKVITYADRSLNKDAVKTLQYYERTGLVDFFPYNQPGKDIAPRNPGAKQQQVFQDGLLTIYDSFERLRGLTYISVLDFDEYLIPSRNRSLKQLMNDLFKTDVKNRVAGFVFKTNYFIKSWGKVNPSSKLELGQYTNRTVWAPIFDRQKLIAMNNRINFYTKTHAVQTKPGYEVAGCPSSEAYMRHYRSCRESWNKNNECMRQFKRVTDLDMINWATRTIAASVGQVRKEIFGN